MTLRNRLSRQAALTLRTIVLVSLFAPSTHATEAATTITGRLSVVKANLVEVDRTQRFQFQPSNAECFDHNGVRMTCQTLVGIGYADRARVTIVANQVRRIDILELQQ